MRVLTKLSPTMDHGRVVNIEFRHARELDLIDKYFATVGVLYYCSSERAWYFLSVDWDGAAPPNIQNRRREFERDYEDHVREAGFFLQWRFIGWEFGENSTYKITIPKHELAEPRIELIDNLIEAL